MEQLPGLTPVLCILLLLPTWAAGLEVHQSPRALQAAPGDTTTLSCSFQNPQGSTAKVSWTRGLGDVVVLDSAHPFYTGRLNVSRLDLLRKGEATMTLRELEPWDSGLYRCHISILQGESGTGQGTELSVMGRNQSAPGAPGGRELCVASGPLYYRAVVCLSLAVLFSLGIIHSLQP